MQVRAWEQYRSDLKPGLYCQLQSRVTRHNHFLKIGHTYRLFPTLSVCQQPKLALNGEGAALTDIFPCCWYNYACQASNVTYDAFRVIRRLHCCHDPCTCTSGSPSSSSSSSAASREGVGHKAAAAATATAAGHSGGCYNARSGS
jgi:hypothetical protein